MVRRSPESDRVCVVSLTLIERPDAPLAARPLQPFHGEVRVQQAKQHRRGRLDQRVVDDRDRLLHAVGLELAA
jgi:hypothetical protein